MSADTTTGANPFDVQEGIFIHHVPEKEMQATLLGKRRLEVPRGHIALVVKDGQVTEVLPAGLQVALGFWERVLGDSGRKSFYVVSLRPIWIQSQSLALQDGQGRSVQYKANIYLTLPSVKDHAKLGQLIARLLVEGEFLDIAQVRSTLSTLVEETVRSSVVRQGAVVDIAASERAILAKLQTQIGAFGFDITVNLTTGEQRLEVNVRMGTGPTPGLKACTSCGTMLQETKKFCTRCGAQQPISTNPSTSPAQAAATAPESRPCINHDCGSLVLSTKKFCTKCGTPQPPVAIVAAASAAPSGERTCVNASCGAPVASTKKFCTKCGTPQPVASVAPSAAASSVTVADDDKLITSDGEPLAADLSLLVEGYAGSANDERIQRAVMAAVRPALQRATSASLSTREGLSTFEISLRPDLERAVLAVGGRLISIGVLDVRLKNNEWVLQARSELERAKQELALDKEWHAQGMQEAEVLGLNYELARKRKSIESSHEMHELKAQLDIEFQRADAQVADRERRTNLQDRDADLNIADARRTTREGLAVDAAKRDLSRTRVAEDHADALRDVGNEAQLSKATRDAVFTEEREQLAHEQAMERDVVVQDLKLRSDAQRSKASDDSFTNRLQSDDEMYAQRARQAFAEDVADRALDRKHKDADLSQERDLSAEDRRKKMRMEEMQSMAQIEASIDTREKQHELEQRRLAVEAEQARARLAVDAEQARLSAAQAGVGTAAILAAQISGQGADAEAIASAIGKVADADAAGGKDRAAAEAERARAAEIEKNRERESAMQNNMMTMMQQMMQQNAAFAQSMVQSQMQVTQTALGNAESAANRERDAMKSAANQAVSMSERSMGAMAQVAAQASTHGPTVVVPTSAPAAGGHAAAPMVTDQKESPLRPSPISASKVAGWTCRGCGSSNEPDDARCGECGQSPT